MAGRLETGLTNLNIMEENNYAKLPPCMPLNILGDGQSTEMLDKHKKKLKESFDNPWSVTLHSNKFGKRQHSPYTDLVTMYTTCCRAVKYHNYVNTMLIIQPTLAVCEAMIVNGLDFCTCVTTLTIMLCSYLRIYIELLNVHIFPVLVL